MTTSRTFQPDSQRAPVERQFIVDQNQPLGRERVFLQQRLNGAATQIHKCLRFGQHYGLPGNNAGAHKGLAFRPGEANVRPRPQPVNRQEAQIVIGLFILRSRISETRNKPRWPIRNPRFHSHSSLFLLLVGSGFLVAAGLFVGNGGRRRFVLLALRFRHFRLGDGGAGDHFFGARSDDMDQDRIGR